VSDSRFDSELIQAENLKFKKITTGKFRRYFSLLNFWDLLKIPIGILRGLWLVYSSMPDVVFGKGGYASFPVLLAARIFRIPVIIHESDSIPGKVNKWAGRFAKRVAISFPETAKYFPKEKTALTGIPIRKNIIGFTPEEGREIFALESGLPTILILGGSQGAQKINEAVLQALPELIKHFQIIHQCGPLLEKETLERANVVLENSIFKKRHHLFGFLDDARLRNAASVADLAISRAGGSGIYEIATWGLASIIIPIQKSAQDHQKENAYNYAKTGAAVVIEENNLSPHVLLSEIQRLMANQTERERMGEAAKKFAKPDAARKLAQTIINLALKHNK
jgi:UDP-N-acetylglucosamine--N-acetylmuramyl-(pentapeptide) pyrophosphoryl-undecaprenol N-acetylglucosamine transferase